MKKDEQPVEVEQSFNVSTDVIWRAITDLDQMQKWYFDNIPDFKPEIGFETQFDVDSGERIFRHLWKVIEVIPNKKLVYNWKYEGYAGDSNIIFELFENQNITTLRLTTQVLESYSKDIPEFKRESCVGGWKYFVQQRLKIFIEENNQQM